MHTDEYKTKDDILESQVMDNTLKVWWSENLSHRTSFKFNEFKSLLILSEPALIPSCTIAGFFQCCDMIYLDVTCKHFPKATLCCSLHHVPVGLLP